MRYVAPIVGAGAGFFLGGTNGAAVGWLIGSWLFGPKSDASAGGIKPEEMPNLNQSLRGSPIFITFGTNRVSANIIWTNNFRAIRHKTSGKGGSKGGGSGGTGSMKGGGAQSAYYTYQWDLMYHFGMVPTPVSLLTAWIGSDRVDEETLDAIAGGDPTYRGVSESTSNERASLTFSEGFYSPGHATGDVQLEAWDHYVSVTSMTHAFPSNVYFGLKDLELGQSPIVPQLSAEIGPSADFGNFTDMAITYISKDVIDFQSAINSGDNLFNAWINDNLVTDYPNGAIIGIPMGITFANSIATTHVGTPVILNGRMTDANGNAFFPGSFVQKKLDGSAGTKYDDWMTPNISYDVTDAGDPMMFMGRILTGSIDTGSRATGYMLATLIWDKQTATARITSVNTGHYGDIAIDIDSRYLGVSSGDKWDQQASGMQIGIDPLSRDVYMSVTYFNTGNTIERKATHAKIGYINDQNQFVKATSPFLSTNSGAAWFSTANPLGSNFGPVRAANGDHYLCLQPAAFPQQQAAVIQKLETGSFYTVAKSQWQADIIAGYLPITTIVSGSYDHHLTFPVPHTNAIMVIGQHPLGGLESNWIFSCYRVGTNSITYEGSRIYNSQAISQWVLGTCVGVGLASGGTRIALATTGTAPIGRTPPYVHLVEHPDAFDYDNSISLNGYLDDICVRVDNQIGDFYWEQFDQSSPGNGTRFGMDQTASFVPLESLGGTDLTPPEVIYQVLTNEFFGLGKTASQINQLSYQEAVSYCEGEGIKISVTYTQADGALAIIDDLLSLYGGWLVESGGIIKFDYAKPLSAVGTPVLVDNRHLLSSKQGTPPVHVVKGAIQDGYNIVRVKYFDRALDYKQNQVEMSDEVDIDLNGPRPREFPGRYVMTGSLATKICERALWNNLYGRDMYQFKLGANRAFLEPGDLITLVDSFHPTLSGGVTARITYWRETSRLEFDVVAVANYDYQIQAQHGYTSTASAGGSGVLVQPTAKLLDFQMYEVPKEIQGSSAKFYVGYNQASMIQGAQLHISPDGDNFILAADQQPWMIGGIFPTGLSSRDHGYVEQNVEFYILPASGFNTSSPTFAQTHDLDDVSQAGRATGTGIIHAGSEAMALQGLTLIGQNHYRADKLYRGWGGTKSQVHSPMAYWTYHAAGMFAMDLTQDRVGTTVWYKVVPYNFSGKQYDISSIDAKTYSLKGMYWRPRMMPSVDTFVQSAISWPASDSLLSRELLAVTSGGCNVDFQWPLSSNDSGFGALGYGNAGFGNFTAEVGTPTYRVQVLSADATTVVRCLVVNTPFWQYTRATNSADFNGFGQDFYVRFTPYNQYGDAPNNQTKHLTLFY